MSCSPKKRHIISASIGVTLAYVFTTLLPELYHSSSQTIAYAILTGFVVFLFLEHIIYRHTAKNAMQLHEKQVHTVFLFAFKVIHGVLMYYLFLESFKAMLLFFISLLAVDLAEDFSLHFIHGKKKTAFAYLVPLGPAAGVFIAWLFPMSHSIVLLFMAFTAGVLMYMVGSELIPKERSKHPSYFVLGLVLFYLVSLGLGVIG